MSTSLCMKKIVNKLNPKSTEHTEKTRQSVAKWDDKDDDDFITGKDFNDKVGPHSKKLPVVKRPIDKHSDIKSKDSSPNKMPSHAKGPEFATRGGGVAYHNVRSKIAKYDNGDPKVVTVEREKMMEKLGKDPGYNVVAMHTSGGSHVGHSGDSFTMGTRAKNTSDSNKARGFAAKKKRFGI